MKNDPIVLKRIYEEPSKEDGYRVLVDRIWPRGVSKEDAKLDDWLKEIAPSTELRKWFNHDPDKFEKFRRRYQKELENHTRELDTLVNKLSQHRVTLLYGARDEQHNHAVVIKEMIVKLQKGK